jgi:uncharacterized protein YndB with AHSA1/START domain
MKTESAKDRLEIARTYKASPEELFEAFTNPLVMAKWFYGNEEGSAEVENDLKVGGSYVVRMHGEGECSGNPPHGEYLVIDPPHRLSFTWIVEGAVDNSVVDISFKRIDEDTTQLTLVHELTPDLIQPHMEGWTHCLNHVAKFCFPAA